MTSFDYESLTNTTFRGECRCEKGFMYQEDTYGDFNFGFCTDECMFGFYTPEDANAKECLPCNEACSECWGPSSSECFECAPWAF